MLFLFFPPVLGVNMVPDPVGILTQNGIPLTVFNPPTPMRDPITNVTMHGHYDFGDWWGCLVFCCCCCPAVVVLVATAAAAAAMIVVGYSCCCCCCYFFSSRAASIVILVVAAAASVVLIVAIVVAAANMLVVLLLLCQPYCCYCPLFLPLLKSDIHRYCYFFLGPHFAYYT